MQFNRHCNARTKLELWCPIGGPGSICRDDLAAEISRQIVQPRLPSRGGIRIKPLVPNFQAAHSIELLQITHTSLLCCLPVPLEAAGILGA